ncbi:hypothetical protein BDM02DRAFT_2070250 [Thelephora ganbajun]|uniref:Uncharacterized protein n=1 Tax=Thelephora ganbajun TaxID=370292 RepID=A0ACB6ZGM8_THEGA|nr:hypothetical protein BDM02DRAFT_2070250 [Thelephora ganbajun]
MGPAPLNVPASPSPNKTPKTSGPNVNGTTKQPAAAKNLAPSDISSPHELTAFVETLLEQLEVKFDDVSSQILERMNQMASRVDALEASIQDIINVDLPQALPSNGTPQSPSLGSSGSTASIRRSPVNL